MVTDGCRIYYKKLRNSGEPQESLGIDLISVPDSNEDSLINLLDFKAFYACMTNQESVNDECIEIFDTNQDGRVDLYDFRHFQNVFGK